MAILDDLKAADVKLDAEVAAGVAGLQALTKKVNDLIAAQGDVVKAADLQPIVNDINAQADALAAAVAANPA